MLPTSSISLRTLSPDYILIYMKIMCTVVSFISIGKFSSKCYLELIVLLYLAKPVKFLFVKLSCLWLIGKYFHCDH